MPLKKVPASDFKSYLQAELVRRCQRNPRYSIRAFAKALDVDASTLAKILNGKRSLGRRAVENMGRKLGMSPKDLETFISSEASAPSSYDQLKLDLFEIISDWHHMAILELMTIENFRNDPKWIAQALGLSIAETKASIERLMNVGMLEIGPQGQWLDKSSGRTTNISPNATNAAARQLQKQFLQKAMDALEDIPLRERDQTAMTMAIDTDKIPMARERIKEFRRDLAKFLCRGDRRTVVYNLTISLYPLTRLERKFDV